MMPNRSIRGKVFGKTIVQKGSLNLVLKSKPLLYKLIFCLCRKSDTNVS